MAQTQQTTYYLYAKDQAIIGQVAKDKGLRSHSEALRFIIRDWVESQRDNDKQPQDNNKEQ